MMREPYAEEDSAREFRGCLAGLKWWERAIFGFCAAVIAVAGWVAAILGWQPEDE